MELGLLVRGYCLADAALGTVGICRIHLHVPNLTPKYRAAIHRLRSTYTLLLTSEFNPLQSTFVPRNVVIVLYDDTSAREVHAVPALHFCKPR
jgi:hypothetical protein